MMRGLLCALTIVGCTQAPSATGMPDQPALPGAGGTAAEAVPNSGGGASGETASTLNASGASGNDSTAPSVDAGFPEENPEEPLTEWPDATNTGVPENLALMPSDSLLITTDGEILDALDVQGSIIVRADDVVIRNSRVTNSATAIRFEEGSNLLVERVTFDGKTATTLDGAIVAWGSITVRRIQVSGFGEGIDIYGTGGLIRDSYFHDMTNANGELMDGIEAWEAQQLVIAHNVIEMPGGNSVIKLPLDVPVPGGDDVLIENNLLAGGGWTVYGGYDPPNPNPSYTNVRFIDNRFSTKFEPKCGFYGPGAFIESNLSHDNVWHETGEPLEL